MKYTSSIHIDRDALRFNIEFLQKEMGEGVLVSSVVKGNAYGHDIETFVPLAEECGIRHFSVFSAHEAQRVHKSLKEPFPIMIMGAIEDEKLEWAIQHGIEFFVFSQDRLLAAIEIAKHLQKKALVHIELETGMNRTGFDKSALLDTVIPFLIKHQEHYMLKGICTHFAGAETFSNLIRIEEQKRAFLMLRKLFLDKGLRPAYTHTCCSAASIRLPDMRFNMVRIGIMQYGFWPSQEIKIEYLRSRKLNDFKLHRVLSWTTELMAVKKVKEDEYIGYGSTYRASRDMLIGIVPVGYANGYSRELSNAGRAIVNQTRTGVIGMVNMNSLALDLTEVNDPKPGDEVILIGEKGELEITVGSFSESANQLNYESLTRLPEDIPRLVIG